MRPMIEIAGLHKSFGRNRALAGLDLDVSAGTVLGLLGHNGAGKTTLVRILATLTRPDRGRARVGGYDVVSQPVAVRRLIGLAGQYSAVDEALTGRENLEIVGRLYRLSRREARRRSAAVLDEFDLAGPADRPVRTYSGGMRRRLDLAASLVGRPPVLLLDEPTAGLDPVARRRLWAQVRGLAAGGTTVLLTTQQLDEADELADDLAVLDHGRLADRGSPADLKRRLGDDRVVVTPARPGDLTRAATVLAGLAGLAALPGLAWPTALAGPAAGGPAGRPPEPPAVDEAAGTVTVTAGRGALAAAVRLLDADHIDLADVTVKPPTLEDVYVTLAGAPRPVLPLEGSRS
jgi:ABC-2 type transport system ATP-binding protein